MATKNLARTVVEGGRSIYSKLDRKERNRRERRLRYDAEGNVVAGRSRRVGGRGFADRLAPLERWLDHNIGRGWNNVYREFCERFDRRTMKGWHLGDHLLQMVGRGRFPWGASFRVDGRGILRRAPRRSWGRPIFVSRADEAQAKDWAAGRQVIVRGDAVFWTARAVDLLIPTSAQGRRLTLEELAFWSSLRGELRRLLTYDTEANRRRRAKADELRGTLR